MATTTTTVTEQPDNADPSPSSSPPPKKVSYELAARNIYYAKPVATPSSLARLVTRPCGAAPAPPDYILRDVSLTARAGEVLAVVGPSGAGKSTLLDILAARTAPTHGRLLLNSAPLRASSFRRLSAHVPQADVALTLLTVSETFAFAASLLHPGSAATAEAAVAALLADLGLAHVAHTRVSPSRLSGGERRRVSIGLALLRNPGVLLLDEPTSGLDSSSAHVVVGCLRAVAAARGTTVVLSIHQPSARLLSAVDSLLLLSRGTVLHHGSLASLDATLLSHGLVVPAQLNPLEFSLEVLDQLPHPSPSNPEPKSSTQELTSPSSESDHRKAAAAATSSLTASPSSRLHELVVLYKRAWKVVYRSKQLLLINFLEAVLVGTLLGTIYIHAGYGEAGAHKRLGLFAFTLTFLLTSTTETLPTFVSERPIVLAETAAGLYRLSSHAAAATLVFLPYLLAVALLYSICVYFLVGLCASPGAFAAFVLVVWAVVLTANSFVLFVSSFAPDYIAGMSLVSVSLAGFFLFSGYFLSRGSMPSYWVFMHYASPYKYALDALLANEYSCAANRCFGVMGGGECSETGRDVLAEKGLTPEERWTGVQVLFGFFLLYRVLYWVVLSRRASRAKR
ncbi:LOW QUALITY PROTEIN: ABC transporter G family member 4-like [Setaria italica]|uniref:LOW QUALITY PROTEIN: ABC transporter G family member 4-like n=1 Tax=Setaria italica TaxID=4555 RepID=UPI000647D099|nr:LOW QUALITY PROTEIN: ABC transporter G family member 4-like [Setaria italica]